MHTVRTVQGSFCLPQEQVSLTQEPPRKCHFTHVSMHGCAAGAAEKASRAWHFSMMPAMTSSLGEHFEEPQKFGLG